MLAAILKLDGRKNRQEVVTEFYNMRQKAFESTDSFSLRLYKQFEIATQAQIAEGDVPLKEKSLIHNLVWQFENK